MALIGTKLSVFLTCLGVWGVIMLLVMGVLARVNAVAFIEDIPLDEKEFEHRNYSVSYVKEQYTLFSNNCFTAGALYAGVVVFGAINYHLNMKNRCQIN